MTEIRSKQLNFNESVVLANGTTATTQTQGDNSTKLATTAYVDNSVSTEDIFNLTGNVIVPTVNGDHLDVGSGSVCGSGFVIPPLANATLAVTFAADATTIDFDLGAAIITTHGGASVSGGYLDLAHNDLRYWRVTAGRGNANFTQTGAIKFIYNPNYSSGPSTNQYIFCFYVGSGSDANLVYLFHMSSNQSLGIYIYDSSGSIITGVNLGNWLPIAGTDYEFEFNLDIDTGISRLLINGAPFGYDIIGTGIRDSTTYALQIGTDRAATYTSNFKIKNLVVFDKVQHTNTYTPGYTLPTYYSYIGATDNKLIGDINSVNSSGAKVLTISTSTNTASFYGTDGYESITFDPAGISYMRGNHTGSISAQLMVGVTFPDTTAGFSASRWSGTESIAGTFTNATSVAGRSVSIAFGFVNQIPSLFYLAKINAYCPDATTGAEYGRLGLYAMNNGAQTELLRLDENKNATFNTATTFSQTTTLSTGTYNAVSVKGIRTLILSTLYGDITLNGLADGVINQEIVIIKQPSHAYTVTIRHLNSGGTQQLVTLDGVDIIWDSSIYGGSIFRYSGAYWYPVSIT
jgi:hypothetical protein